MSKSIKANARTVAAPKVEKPRAEFIDAANRIQEAGQSFASALYDGAMLCRKLEAKEQEMELLKSVVDRRRWAEFKVVVTCPAKYFTPTAPKNLGALSRFLKARMAGGNAQQAKSVAVQKTSMAELKEKLGKAPAKKGAQNDKADKAAPNGAPLHDLHDALERAKKEYGANTIALSVIEEMESLYADLLSHTAEA